MRASKADVSAQSALPVVAQQSLQGRICMHSSLKLCTTLKVSDNQPDSLHMVTMLPGRYRQMGMVKIRKIIAESVVQGFVKAQRI